MEEDSAEVNLDDLLASWQEALVEPFTATVEVRTEFVGALSRQDFEHWWALHPEGRISIDEATFNILREDGRVWGRLENVRATSQYEALARAEELFAVAMAAISLDAQRDYKEQERGHVRLVFRRDEIEVQPWKSMLPSKGAIGTSQFLDVGDAQPYARAASTHSDLRMLLHSYYTSLAPTAADAKYYSAFALIEYIETIFSCAIRSTPVASKHQRECAVDAASRALASADADDQAIEIARTRISDVLARATKEPRAQKLSVILNTIFGLTAIVYRQEDVKIDVSFCRELIRVRNDLFHASGATRRDRDRMKRASDQLIILAGEILHHLLTTDELSGAATRRQSCDK